MHMYVLLQVAVLFDTFVVSIFLIPAMMARMPYRLLLTEVGYHSVLKKNFNGSHFENKNPAPSRKTKKKMPKTKIMALIPQILMVVSIRNSEMVVHCFRVIMCGVPLISDNCP